MRWKAGESSPDHDIYIYMPNLFGFLCMLLFPWRMLHQYAQYIPIWCTKPLLKDQESYFIFLEDALHGNVWDPRRVTCYVIKLSEFRYDESSCWQRKG